MVMLAVCTAGNSEDECLSIRDNLLYSANRVDLIAPRVLLNYCQK